MEEDEEFNEDCPADSEQSHCRCWWDGEECCRCQARAMSQEDKKKQGMLE